MPSLRRVVPALFASLLIVRSPAHAQSKDSIDALIAKMTLEERAGQLAQWGGGIVPTGPQAAAGSEEDIRRGRVGSFLSVWGADTTRRLQKIAVEETRLHVPLLFSADVIHGFRTIFPVPLAEAATWDVDLAQRCARTAAIEASAYGVHWAYAPMVDIARDPRWGRIVEGAGEDPYLGSAFAVARVRGFQTAPFADATAVLSTAKHFVAYGAAEAGRDYNIVDVSDRTLREIYLPPFRAAVEAGVSAIMPAFNEIAGVPMHANKKLVHDMLRGEWGFGGIVVSDYTGIKELIMHGVSDGAPHAGELAFDASIDIDMMSSIYWADLPALVRSGRIQESALNAAVKRVLEAKQKLGLFDDPYRYSDSKREASRILTPEARALAREAARKSIVLLKNDKALLPLKKDIGTLAVMGALADDGRSVLGSWAAIGEPKDAVGPLAGIRQAVSAKTKILYARGAAPIGEDTSGFDEAVRVAREADAVVMVLGESEAMSGEASNRSFLGLPGAQQALLERVQATGKPLVVVLMNGRPLALPWLVEHVPAIVESWFAGVEAGHGLADILFGDANPSGKLPVSFPRNVGQVPIYYDHKRTGRPPSAADHYTSKYLDVAWTPQFSFGYGLSYTRFAYDPPRLSAQKIGPTDSLTVRVTVHNTGSRAGTEVVQLYLRDDVATFTRPVEALRGFARVELAPGASRELTFTLDQEDFALLDADFQRVVEPGTFTVFVGGNSVDVQSAQFSVTRSAKLAGLGSAIPRFMRTAATGVNASESAKPR
ncbi:MAG TPA: glycoside hydrolase family 3 N-terminal domain-containing protein [Polyangiales bacterium]|jgi:beta-glucosidase